MNQQAILRDFEDTLNGLGREPTTIRKYLEVASGFLNEVALSPGEPLTSMDALRYLGRRRENYKTSSRQVYHYALKALFKSMGLTWDLPGPKSTYEELDQPVLSREQVSQMIQTMKDHPERKLPAYLAIATTFGPRVSELAAIEAKHVENGTLIIQTRKRGMPRRHQIPEAIGPYLQVHWRKVSVDSMYLLFKQMLYETFGELESFHGYGWHSIRRAVVTELLQEGLDIMLLYKFMRWKPIGMLVLPMTYNRLEDPATDEQVFEKHPFLKMWEEKHGLRSSPLSPLRHGPWDPCGA